MNSYNTFPAVNYIVSAIGIKIARIIGYPSDLIAARLPNLLFGFILVVALYFAGYNFGLTVAQSALCTAAVCGVPQVIYIFSYLNQDFFGLTTSALVLHSVSVAHRLVLNKSKVSRGAIWYLGITIGLMLSSKYNYFVFIPALACYAYWLSVKLSEKQTAISVIVIAVITCAPWYIRNLILYGDILGHKFILSKMLEFHALGIGRSLTPSGVEFLFSQNWPYLNFKTFFAFFGYLTVPVAMWWYMLLMIMSAVFLVGSIFLSGMSRNRDIHLVTGGALIISLLSILMSAYHSLAIDFQAQGRYLFPILICIFVTLSSLIKEYPRLVGNYVFCCLLMLMPLLCMSSLALYQAYR